MSFQSNGTGQRSLANLENGVNFQTKTVIDGYISLKYISA